ncbi:MAG: Gfo/Idh/MocA family protein [Sphaerochaetaceae bacterium]
MNIGIIGAGGIAKKMARTVNEMDDAVLYSIASRSIEKAESFAGEFDVEKAYGSYEQLVSDDKVDLIYVATPHSHHFEHMKLALEHDKPVLCEKAFTVNAKQAKEILQISKERNVLVAEAIWTRYLPSRKMIDDLIDSKIIGEVKSVTANLGYVIDHVPRLAQPSLAGGALLDVGVYTINFAMMVLGNAYENIFSAATFTETGVDAQNSITLTYPKMVTAILHSSQLALTDRRGMIFGTKGFIEVENINNPERIRVFDKNYELLQDLQVPPQITGFEYQVRVCMEAIRKGSVECEQMPHSEILKVMETMDMIRAQWNMTYPFE